jgi:hypothetical protein
VAAETTEHAVFDQNNLAQLDVDNSLMITHGIKIMRGPTRQDSGCLEFTIKPYVPTNAAHDIESSLRGIAGNER